MRHAIGSRPFLIVLLLASGLAGAVDAAPLIYARKGVTGRQILSDWRECSEQGRQVRSRTGGERAERRCMTARGYLGLSITGGEAAAWAALRTDDDRSLWLDAFLKTDWMARRDRSKAPAPSD